MLLMQDIAAVKAKLKVAFPLTLERGLRSSSLSLEQSRRAAVSKLSLLRLPVMEGRGECWYQGTV